MALVVIDGGFYDAETHGYYGPDGKFVPSATQILTLIGLSDFSMVRPEVIQAKREIGLEAHDLCATIDMHGDIDPSWISERTLPYVTAYQLFRREKHFVPHPEWVEKPMIACVHGMRYGVTPDAFGKLDGYDAILERKCVEAPQASWAVQTALQEMAIYKANHCGRAQRFALQLKKNSRYHIDPHHNHALDCSRAIAFLTTIYARLDAGQKLWEKL